MRGQASARMGKYLYAIAHSSRHSPLDFPGINGSRVYLISSGRLAAVVSDVVNQKIRPERRHLASHQAVLKRLMAEETVLPVSFGVVSKGAQAVRDILSRNEAALREQLRRVSGKLEMGLRITWEVPDIFEYFINTHPDLRQARDQLFGNNSKPTRQQMIEMGRLFHRILNEDREAHTEEVERILLSRCVEIKRNPPQKDQEIANLACLVGREKLADFEAGVFEVARSFNENFTLGYSGPWAPHNFVDLGLENVS